MERIIVVGAGIVGLSCAYALRRRGLEVVVLDRAAPGSGASHGNGGWVCPSYSDPLPAPGLLTTSLQWLLRAGSPLYVRPRPDPDFWRFMWQFQRACNPRSYQFGLEALARLNERTFALYDAMAADGVPFEMHAQGLLFLFRSEAGERETAHNLSTMHLRGHPVARRLEPRELRAEGIDVADDVIGGLLAPEERHVRPESVIDGLTRRLGELGVPVHSGERVQAIERAGGRVSGVRTTRETLSASHVVLTAGVWSRHLAATVGLRLPLEAGKGYSVTMSAPPSMPSRPLYCSEAHVGLSPYEGALRVLGTMELSGLNSYLNPRRVALIKEAPRAYLRGWQVADVREEWTGPRPLTPDGLPFIGPAPGLENLIVAAGHAMLGITLGPSTGEAVADLICGRPDEVLLAPFRVDRF